MQTYLSTTPSFSVDMDSVHSHMIGFSRVEARIRVGVTIRVEGLVSVAQQYRRHLTYTPLVHKMIQFIL